MSFCRCIQSVCSEKKVRAGSTSATSARDERLLKAASSKIVSAARGMVKARERELRAGATALREKLAAQKRQQQHLQQQRKEQQRDPNEARTTQHGSSPAMSQPSPMDAVSRIVLASVIQDVATSPRQHVPMRLSGGLCISVILAPHEAASGSDLEFRETYTSSV